MVGETDGWPFCPHESQDLHSNQPSAHQIPDYTEHGDSVHPWRWFYGWRVLRTGRLLEHRDGCASVCLGQHPRRMRRRGRSPQAASKQARLLVRDYLRLPVLPVHLCGNEHRIDSKSRDRSLPRLGRVSVRWSSGQFPGGRLCAASVCIQPSREVPGSVAKEGGQTETEPADVYRAPDGVYYPSLFPPLCSSGVRSSEHNARCLYCQCDRRESRLDHCLVLVPSNFDAFVCRIFACHEET